MSEIDRATIKIEADASSVASEGAKAKQAIEGGFSGSLKKAREAAFGLLGTLGSIAATATGMYKLGQIIREEIEFRLKSGADRAKDFAESLDLSKQGESVGKLGAQIDTLNSRIAGSQESFLGSARNLMAGDTVASMKEQAAELDKTRTSVLGSINAKERRAREKKAADEKAEREKKITEEAAAADAAVRDSIGKTLEGEAKILAERNANIMRLKDAQAKASTDYAKSTYDTAIEFEKRAADAAIAEHKRGVDKKREESEKAAKEDLDRFTKLAAAQADAIERTLRRINQEAASQSNLDQFVAMGNRIERLLGAIERQRPG